MAKLALEFEHKNTCFPRFPPPFHNDLKSEETPELSRMEFAAPNEQANRKIYDGGDWCLEYATAPTAELSTSQGAIALFAFHGFARPLEDMLPISEVWPEPRLLISIHLPHHGNSLPALHPLDSPISPKRLMEILTAIGRQEGARTDTFDMIGYSIGGRVALSLLCEAPQQWSRMVLMAPDGLKKSLFYGLTVHTRLGRFLWFAIDRRAERVMQWTDRLLRWGWISKHLHTFGQFHLVNHGMRMMVWNGWRSHRLCWPSHSEIALSMKKSEGKIDVFFGEHDAVIPPSNGREIQRMVHSDSNVGFHLLPSGHGMLRKDILEHLVQRIFPT